MVRLIAVSATVFFLFCLSISFDYSIARSLARFAWISLQKFISICLLPKFSLSVLSIFLHFLSVCWICLGFLVRVILINHSVTEIRFDASISEILR